MINDYFYSIAKLATEYAKDKEIYNLDPKWLY